MNFRFRRVGITSGLLQWTALVRSTFYLVLM